MKVKDDKQNSNKEETVIDEFTEDVIPTDDDNEDEEETQLPDESIKISISGSASYWVSVNSKIIFTGVYIPTLFDRWGQ